MESNTLVRFRVGTPVTNESPQIIPGSFIFDSESLILYLDLDTGKRVQVYGQMKFSLDGAEIQGDIEVVNDQGSTMSCLTTDGIVYGQFLETHGEIHLDTTPGFYAVIDEDGRIRTRSVAEVKVDLGLGSFAYKSSASGTYTPLGSVSAPEITVDKTHTSVVKSITAGDLPELIQKVEGETFAISFVRGTQTTSESVDVLSDVDVTSSAPEFTGTQSTITVS